jgi:cell fate regulator YaaT (PSP1 superfamily)
MKDEEHLEIRAIDDSDEIAEKIAGKKSTRGKAMANVPYPLYRIKVVHSSETLLAPAPEGLSLVQGAFVIVDTRYGKDLGRILGAVEHPGDVAEEDIHVVERLAGEHDLRKRENDCRKEAEAYRVCQEKIRKHDLEMKLVSAHYLLDEPKVLFFFTAESRVDFRELVKDLVSVFKMRIELRQIGVRDESRVVGGAGVCGRCFCCHCLTDHLRPVSIKMAKEQNLSLNSMKISGPCGRLLCCLSYEFDFYQESRSTVPTEGMRINADGTVFRVMEVNVQRRTVRIHGEDARILALDFDKFRFNDADRKWNIDPSVFSLAAAH